MVACVVLWQSWFQGGGYNLVIDQSLVEGHILHPEVQRKEEAHFILGWKLAHIPGSKGGHTLGIQGACTGLLSVGTVIMFNSEDPG